MKYALTGENNFTITCSADYKNIDAICQKVQKFLQNHDLEGSSFAVILGVREMLTNAIRHGCGSDDTGEISFSMALKGRTITLEAKDPGPGFDWRAMAQKEAKSHETHGRGLGIFKQYFDTYRYNDQGNRLRLQLTL